MYSFNEPTKVMSFLVALLAKDFSNKLLAQLHRLQILGM